MGVSTRLVNLSRLFSQIRGTPVIINTFSESSEKEKEAFNNLIYTKYSVDDLLSILPRCVCGLMSGKYNVGVKCKKCSTLVKEPMERDLEPLAWIQAPKGVKPLINLHTWSLLTKHFKEKGFDVIQWMCHTDYRTHVNPPAVLQDILALGIPRGYNNFVENFDFLFNALCGLKAYKSKRNASEELRKYIYTQRDCIFSEFIPLPNKALLIIEETHGSTFVDPMVNGAVDAIRTMVGIDLPMSDHSIRVKENRTVKTIAQLSEFYTGLYGNMFAKKEGVFRKHLYGTRSHFSFRGVISSITEAHFYRELHLSWGIGISVFRIHLMNKLYHRGYTGNEAIGFLNAHTQQYHPLLDALFKELIEECPYPGIPLIFQRNPSLGRGSAQALFATKVKTDVFVPTISLPITITPSYNADFDGDQLNGTLNIDHVTTEQLEALAPYKNMFALDSPRKVSNNLSHPKTVVSTFANWLDGYDEDPYDPEKERRMASIPEAA